MALEFLTAFLPTTTVAGAIWLFVQALIVFIVMIVVEHFLEHGIEAKHSLIMCLIAFFVIPIISTAVVMFVPMLTSFGPIFVYGFPLVIWLILGELLLEADIGTKLLIAFIAWIVWLAIFFGGSLTGIPAMISQFVPF